MRGEHQPGRRQAAGACTAGSCGKAVTPCPEVCGESGQHLVSEGHRARPSHVTGAAKCSSCWGSRHGSVETRRAPRGQQSLSWSPVHTKTCAGSSWQLGEQCPTQTPVPCSDQGACACGVFSRNEKGQTSGTSSTEGGPEKGTPQRSCTPWFCPAVMAPWLCHHHPPGPRGTVAVPSSSWLSWHRGCAVITLLALWPCRPLLAVVDCTLRLSLGDGHMCSLCIAFNFYLFTRVSETQSKTYFCLFRCCPSPAATCAGLFLPGCGAGGWPPCRWVFWRPDLVCDGPLGEQTVPALSPILWACPPPTSVPSPQPRPLGLPTTRQ